MKPLLLAGLAAIAAANVQAQTEQDMRRFERHVEAHDLTAQGGNCVVSFTLTNSGYIAALDLSKCAAKDQAGALTRLAAALPFPVSSTVGRDITMRL
jgi:hypothetical protein